MAGGWTITDERGRILKGGLQFPNQKKHASTCHACGEQLGEALGPLRPLIEAGCQFLEENGRTHLYCQRCVRARS
jgi:hypothetical protein